MAALDDFLDVLDDGKPAVVNLARVTKATFFEHEQELVIEFAGGASLTLKLEEAARVWGVLSPAGRNDEVMR